MMQVLLAIKILFHLTVSHPFVTSGIRIGTAAGTTRGFKEEQFKYIGNLISEVIDSLKNLMMKY